MDRPRVRRKKSRVVVAVETTLRRDLETTSLRRPLKAIRCEAINPKTQRICNKMLIKLDGRAQITCPRCGTRAFYSSNGIDKAVYTDAHSA